MLVYTGIIDHFEQMKKKNKSIDVDAVLPHFYSFSCSV